MLGFCAIARSRKVNKGNTPLTVLILVRKAHIMISRPGFLRSCAAALSIVFLMVDCLLASQVPGIADIAIDGDKLTVTTANLAAYFKGADLVRLHNRLTQEE